MTGDITFPPRQFWRQFTSPAWLPLNLFSCIVLPPSTAVAPSFCLLFPSPFPDPSPVSPNLGGACPGLGCSPRSSPWWSPSSLLSPSSAQPSFSPFRVPCAPCCLWLSSLPRLARRRRFPRDLRAASANKHLGPLPCPHSSSLCGTDKNKWEKSEVGKFLRFRTPCKALSKQPLCCLIPDFPALPGPVTLLCWLWLELWQMENQGWLVRCYWWEFLVFWILN